MPKKKRPEESPKKQFERFIETARETGADERTKDVEKSFKTLASRARKKSVGQEG